MWIDVVSVVIRALSFIAVLQAAGIALFLAIFARVPVSSSRSIALLGKWTAGFGVALVVIHQLLNAGRMAGEWSGIFDASLQQLAFSSSSAAATALRVVALLVLAVALPYRKHTLAITASVLICMSFTLTGHTSIHAQRIWLAPLLWLHLMVVAFWFGALLPLLMVARHEPASVTAEVVANFSRIATWIVPVIALAGTAIAGALLPDLNVLLQPYGLLLLAKLFGFSLLMMLAALNKWRFAPRVAAGDARAGLVFRRSVIIEFVLICLVLSATAVMTGLFSPDA